MVLPRTPSRGLPIRDEQVASPGGDHIVLHSTSRTFRMSTFDVNGFSSKNTPGSKMP